MQKLLILTSLTVWAALLTIQQCYCFPPNDSKNNSLYHNNLEQYLQVHLVADHTENIAPKEMINPVALIENISTEIIEIDGSLILPNGFEAIPDDSFTEKIAPGQKIARL